MGPHGGSNHNLGMCPDWESNQQPPGVQGDAPTESLSQGNANNFYGFIIYGNSTLCMEW